MPKLLVVDDEIAVCDILKHFFVKQGYQVFMATRGEEALAIIEKDHPQLMLLDIKMPTMSGIEVLRQVRKQGWDIKVVVVSAAHDESVMSEAKRLGAVDYVVKPFHLDYLEQVVLRKLASLVPTKSGEAP